MRPNLADIVGGRKRRLQKAGVSEVRRMARPVVSTHKRVLISNTQTHCEVMIWAYRDIQCAALPVLIRNLYPLQDHGLGFQRPVVLPSCGAKLSWRGFV